MTKLKTPTATAKKKIAPPAPRMTGDGRSVEVPPTTGAQLTTAGDGINTSKTRADWREQEFIRLLRQHGKYVIWRKALLCPCLVADTGQVRVDCDRCNGDGYIYVAPHRIQAVMMQFDKKTSIYERYGLFQEGSCQVTTEPQHRLGYRDSIEMLDSVIAMNELLTKGNRRGRRRVLPDGVDSARFRIVSISHLLSMKDDGSIVALEEGLYFTITDEGWIRWTERGDRLLKDGATFTVHYDFHPIFICISWMHVTRDDVSGRNAPRDQPRTVSHPVQAMLKLDFLVDVNGLPSLDEPYAREATGSGNDQ